MAGQYTDPPRATETAWSAGARIWQATDIARVRRHRPLRLVLPSLLGTLHRHGLAVQNDEPGDPFGRTARTMQQRWISDFAQQQQTASGSVSPILGNVQFYAPAGS